MYETVFVPEMVCLELDVGRLTRPDTLNPRQLPWVTVVRNTKDDIVDLPPNELGPGELSVIAYAHRHSLTIAGLDDLEARRFAQSVGLKIVGTPGILIQAKHLGFLKAVRPALGQLTQSGFYLSQPLFNHILSLVNE
ncbi:MAG: DUF3368 domain-containing protein [Chloroflexota bacterium]